MLCYRDRSWCSHKCENYACGRNFTPSDEAQAIQWWGSDEFPLAVSDFKSDDCGYIPPKELQCVLRIGGNGTQWLSPLADDLKFVPTRDTLGTKMVMSLGCRLKKSSTPMTSTVGRLKASGKLTAPSGTEAPE